MATCCVSSAADEEEEEEEDADEVATVCANDTDFLRRALPPVEPPVEGHDDDGCESAARELRGAGDAYADRDDDEAVATADADEDDDE